MKKLCFVLVVFSLLVFVSCGGSSNKDNSTADTDSGDTVTDEDSADTGSANTKPDGDVSEPTENPDAGDSDTTSDSDNDLTDSTDDADSSDSAPDSDDMLPANDNPDNLPECSPTSATPCIDSEAENSDSEKTNLIWSGKSPERLRWTDAINYCKNLKEGGYSDWQLPSIAALKTLITCEPGSWNDYDCSNADGKYNRFGDIDFFWSASQGKGVDFYTGNSGVSKSDAETYDVRCVRKEITSKQADCSELPENAQWNSASSIIQNWQWEDVSWNQIPKTIYDEKAINTACTFTCKENYLFDSSSNQCLNPCDSNPCDSLTAIDATCVALTYELYSCAGKDPSSGLTWSGKALKKMFWNAAVSYCDDLTESGYSDWRLPTISELRTLIQNCPATETGGECGVTDNCLSDDCRNDACSGCSSDSLLGSTSKYSKLGDKFGLLSSSVPSEDSDSHWYVLFFRGSVDIGSNSTPNDNITNVRCVRSK